MKHWLQVDIKLETFCVYGKQNNGPPEMSAS